MSMDGYIAEKNGNTDWMVWNRGDEWDWDDFGIVVLKHVPKRDRLVQ